MKQWFIEVMSGEYFQLFGIFLSIILGFILGLERELTNKWAGLRTHIMVCLGSCLFTLLSIHGFPIAATAENTMRYGDPSRVAAQILTGIGFIGGGTVLRHGSSIYGLTTAATLWVAASIGMACGCGLYKLGILTTLLSVCVLVLIRAFEKTFIRKTSKFRRKIEIIINADSEHADSVFSLVMGKFDYILETRRHKSEKDDNIVKIKLIVEIREKIPVKEIYSKLSDVGCIEALTVRELYE